MAILVPSDKLSKADDSLTLYKYDNGYLVEVGGRDHNDEWSTAKILVNSLEDAFLVIKDADSLPRS
jgi:hypothetical protein